ncbi:hypothetical protein [Xylophilus sp. ASV27]|uniref:hypothetical protein n=1 Tax=Xylophilus sp. ASV27 TaxID=2795129 RepID=UPI0018EBD78C|nr:hypothetical protein [Xylophilus sp. ASV27]
MRSPFGLLGLVLALLIAGLLAKAALRGPATPPAGGTAAAADVLQQRDQAVQQVQKALDEAADTARRQRDAAEQR